MLFRSYLSGSPAVVRNDVVINFHWGSGSPAAGVPADNFSARWSRTWNFSEGRYRFHATVDDGVRVYVDDALVIDGWHDSVWRELIGERWLWGGNHTLRVEYYEHTGEASIVVWAEKISTSEEPEADFDADRRTGNVPLRVKFDNESNGDYDDCKWYFGDGDTSRDCGDPSHTYHEAGRYTVKLKVWGPAGEDSREREDYITVRPVADFTAAPLSGLQPLLVSFANHSTPFDRCEWDFGDGSTSTESNPTHTYAAAGVYSVQLKVREAGVWSDTKIRTNYIAVTGPVPDVPVVKFIASPTSGEAPLQVMFTNHTLGAITQWQWDFGDGSTSTEKNPVHSYTTAGAYTVSLTATGPGGTDNVTRPNYIIVTAPPPPAPTTEPTAEPTVEPTAEPTTEPTIEPTIEPTVEPTTEPTAELTVEPTTEPTIEPTIEPTAEPTTEFRRGWRWLLF